MASRSGLFFVLPASGGRRSTQASREEKDVNTDNLSMSTAWTRKHTAFVSSPGRDTELDDLEPLRDIVGDARVVAIGEGAHFVHEFHQIQRTVMQFLIERCGFTVFAFEYSFAASESVDAWLRGGDTRPLARVASAAAEWGASDLMEWLREHNSASRVPTRFVGVDLAEAGGALRPVLEPLAELMAQADPESEELVRRAVSIGDEFLNTVDSGAAAAHAWGGLPTGTQNELTAVLSRLALRFDAVRPLMEDRVGAAAVRRAERLLAAARATDYQFGSTSELFAGLGKSADMSVRKLYMAETLAWHLREAGPEAKIVLVSHNNHIQKTPAVFGGVTTALPTGQRLAQMFGEDYVSIAVTHTADTVPEMIPDQSSPVGFRVEEVPAAASQPGSIEHALAEAGFAGQATLTGLRSAPTGVGGVALLGSIRTQSAVMLTDLPRAFDAIISVPTATRDRTVKF
jgi:erythromycin esterase